MSNTTVISSRRHSASAVTVLLLLVLAAGCQKASDENERLEHLRPAHKPHSYAEAIEQLQLRHARISRAEPRADSEAEVGQQEHQELRDIIGWLPELAADSPLKKPAWDEIHAISKQLLAAYETPGKVNDSADALIGSLEKHVVASRNDHPYSPVSRAE